MRGFVVGVVRGVMGIVGLGVVLFGLHAAGQGAVAPPPPDVGAFPAWLRARDPLLATVALLRVVALGISWYLAGISLLALLSRLTGLRVLARLAMAVSTPTVRRMTHGMVGLSLVAAVAVPAAASSTGEGWSPPSGAAQATVGWRPPTLDGPTELPSASGTPQRPDPSASDPHSSERPSDHPSSDPAQLDEHVVQDGESLWTIAADVVADRVERRTSGSATDAEIAGYWRRLLEVNSGRLLRPHDPDVILPGQRFVLPGDGADGVPDTGPRRSGP